MSVKPYLVILFSLSFLYTNAQIQIQGRVMDSTDRHPLVFASVILRSPYQQGKLIGATTTDSMGYFSLQADTGHYLMAISYIGYATQQLNIFLPSGNPRYAMGVVLLSRSNTTLSPIQITASKLVLQFRPGMIVYAVQNDPRTMGRNGLEILGMAPLVSISGGSTIQLKGSSHFLLQINGKDSRMFSGNPTEFLQSLQRDQIDHIEIITNPSAKYAAEGVGGIINIVLKKNNPGTFGSFNTGYDTYKTTYYALNLSGKTGKLGYTFNGIENIWRNGTYDYALEQTIKNQPNLVTGQTTPKRNNFFGTASLSYDLSKKDILNADAQVFAGRGKINNSFQHTSDTFLTRNALQYQDLSLGLDWQHQIDSLHSFVFSYKWEHILDNSDVQTQQMSPTQSKGHSNEHAFQLDVKGKSLEYGTKISLRNLASHVYMLPEAYQTDFIQNIYAAYLTYRLNIGKYNLEAGLREEYAFYQGKTNDSLTFYQAHSSQLFPSISLDRGWNQGKWDFSLGYSRRINRPQLYYLNPFVNTSNPYQQATGNPSLKPEIMDNMEARLTRQDAMGNYQILEIDYGFTHNSIEDFYYPIQDSMLQSTYINFRRMTRWGISFYGNWRVWKKVQATLSANLYQERYPLYSISMQSSAYDLSQHGWYGSFQFNLNGTLFKKFRWSFSNTYSLPDLYLQGKGSGFLYDDMMLLMPFLKNKFMAIAAVRQPFFTDYTARTKLALDPYFQAISRNTTPQRRFFIGLRYAFGKPYQTNKATRKKIQDQDKKTKTLQDIIH